MRHRTFVPAIDPPVTTGEPGDPLASFRLDDRLIVVTGASEGIGRAFAECFAKAGALVVLASRRKDKLESVRQAIVASGGRAEVVTTDVTRLQDIRALEAAVERLVKHDGRRLVLVNNAGFGFTKPALEVSERDWDTLFDTHVKGAFFCSQHIAPLMLERGHVVLVHRFDSRLGRTPRRGEEPAGANGLRHAGDGLARIGGSLASL